MDAGNALACVRICVNFVPSLPLLHYCIETLGDILMKQESLQRTIRCLVEQLDQDLRVLHHRKPVLSVLLPKLVSVRDNNTKQQEGLRTLEYIVSHCPDTVTLKDSHKQLALHAACECGTPWDDGLCILVKANVFALKEMDPKSKLMPFCLVATTTSANVSTIYELLRRDPGVL